MLRHRCIGVAAAAAALLLVSACGSAGSSGSPSASPASSSAAASATGSASAAPTFSVMTDGPAPAVTGAPGKNPTIAKGTGTPPTALVINTLAKGAGAVIATGDLVVTNFAVQKWTGSTPLGSTYTSGGPTSFPIGLGQVIPAWEKLVGQHVGARVEMVVPPAAGFGSAGNSQAGVAPTDTLVFVFDLLGAYPSKVKATGTPGAKPPAGITVSDGGNAGPTVTVAKGLTAPTAVATTRLLQGSGPVVKAGQTVVVQYTGLTFADGKVFDSSWKRGVPAAFTIGSGQVIKGWDTGIVGAHVGDRLLLVIPPAQGYGSSGQPQAGIPANATLVFVVDIIAAI